MATECVARFGSTFNNPRIHPMKSLVLTLAAAALLAPAAHAQKVAAAQVPAAVAAQFKKAFPTSPISR